MILPDLSDGFNLNFKEILKIIMFFCKLMRKRGEMKKIENCHNWNSRGQFLNRFSEIFLALDLTQDLWSHSLVKIWFRKCEMEAVVVVKSTAVDHGKRLKSDIEQISLWKVEFWRSLSEHSRPRNERHTFFHITWFWRFEWEKLVLDRIITKYQVRASKVKLVRLGSNKVT